MEYDYSGSPALRMPSSAGGSRVTFIRNHNLASPSQTYAITDSIFLIQNHEKEYFIKYRGFGNIQKPRIETPRGNRA
jgi:hypothetical protein